MHISFRLLLLMIIAIAVFLTVFVFLPGFLGFDVVAIAFGNNVKERPVIPQAGSMLDFYDIQRPLTEGQQHYAPSEIGCAIANSIAYDFSQYGTKGERSCFGNGCPVAAGIFSLSGYWPFTNYMQEDERLQPYNCAACPASLDEVCVTRNLAVQPVGAATLCNSPIYSEQSSQFLRFGNSVCAGFNPDINYVTGCPTEGGWDGCCPNLCPADDTVKEWRADDTSWEDVLNDDFRHGQNQQLIQDGSRYGWVVYWANSLGGYVIEFPRVPTNKDIGSANPIDVIEDMGQTFKNSLRDNPAGSSEPELRAVADRTFVASGGMGFVHLALTMESAIMHWVESTPIYYDMRYERCSDLETCTDTRVKGLVERVEIEDKDGNVKHTHHWPDLYPHEHEPVDYNLFKLRTNIPDDGEIIAGHRYRLILNHYRSEPVKVSQDPVDSPGCQQCAWMNHQYWCEGRGGADVGYLGCSCGTWAGHACGWSEEREGVDWCARDCGAGDLHKKYYYLTYVDYSMILLDMGAA